MASCRWKFIIKNSNIIVFIERFDTSLDLVLMLKKQIGVRKYSVAS